MGFQSPISNHGLSEIQNARKGQGQSGILTPSACSLPGPLPALEQGNPALAPHARRLVIRLKTAHATAHGSGRQAGT